MNSVSGAIDAQRCRVCAARLKTTFVDLGMSPLCESFLTAAELDSMERTYPLHALVCGECLLVQLKAYVDPDHIFREYAYFSSYSTSWVAHAKAYCEMITARLGLGPGSLAVELASNDGYLLQHFPALGVPCLGIEPAVNVAEVAALRGIPVVTEFFGVTLAQRLIAEGKRADLIIGNNVLAQVPDINDFVAGIALLLKPDGVATLEFPHLERLMAENQFDTIYHEHFSYFSLIAIDVLVRRHGLRLIDVEQLATHGGSLRIYLAHETSARETSPQVEALLAHETAAGFRDLSTYHAFAAQVKETKRRLLATLIGLKDEGKRICGYGAPGKGNTLLNYCGIGPDFLDFTVDRNPYKHHRFTPGMHIPIMPVEALDVARPDYILILPWNLKTEIMAQMKDAALEWRAKFIIPIPQATIIDPLTL
jgi:hypothetical protein